MAFIERTDLRGRQRKIFQDDVNPALKRAIITAHDQHYHDGTTWQDADEAIVAGTVTGFAHKVDRLRHAIHMGSTGTRRWMPRRNVPGEYVEFGRLQSWGGTAWANVNLGTPVRTGNTLVFNTTNFKLTLLVTWRHVKIEVVLKTAAALRRLRWQVTLVGLTWNNWGLYSGETLVGTVDRPTAWDANGSPDNPNITINTSYAAGFVEFGGDVAGATLPITIDPTLSTQPDETSSIDTYINSEYPDTVYSGASDQLYIGERSDRASVRRSLIQFDLSSLDGTETLNTITLSLYVETDYSTNARTFRAYRLKVSWAEDSATWNSKSTGVSWTSAGAFHADDCEQTDIGTRDFTATEAAGMKDFVLTPTSKAALDLGYGWLLKADTESDDGYRFSGAGDAVTAQRPKLVVEYTEAGGGGDPEGSLIGGKLIRGGLLTHGVLVRG